MEPWQRVNKKKWKGNERANESKKLHGQKKSRAQEREREKEIQIGKKTVHSFRTGLTKVS